ncbi:NADH:ubiquinone dehydrogenase [Operophtera brumata]|uniref:NADH:ubiquinone dehydrogenase n=1 Tax=Operophtera brumata TaxID=104452 RepID=A0A0L7LIC6_OPEBR|nr:NADH:ubiquinone dehydrogenase [Operophtera brumata]
MSISPFLRSPFTDITGGMISHQLLGKCQKEEVQYMDCLEAYGLDRGRAKCHHLLDDFKECQTSAMRAERDKQISEGKLTGDKKYALRKERDRQIACGKLTGDKKYVSPRIDAY